ncbi:MAG: zf-HC2 domain-containing protein [Elusimicrobiota bacterium]
MNCKRAMEISAGGLSGALSDAEKAELSGHLDECASCRKEAELLSKAWQALELYEAPALGDKFVDALVAKLRAGQAQEQASGFNPFALSPDTRAALTGWWKVPAMTLASFAVYVLCVETGLMPARQFSAPAAQSSGSALSNIFSDGTEAGGGNLLTMLEGADK